MSWDLHLLSGWQWAVLAAVPPLIVLLYFLKLKRQPLEVPSTYLWRKSIEDLHVNSIWQRLRQSLLLFLQLLLVLLAILALLKPSWRGTELAGDRVIFLIDTSASMSASDVQPSRLEEAKRQIGELIDQMKSGDVAMLISFSNSAIVEQSFTDNRRELHRRLDDVRQTSRSTALAEALRVAAGLANPGRAIELENQVAEGFPAALYIFSDGKFPDVEGFSLGNLKPIFMPIGQKDAGNIGITAFSTRRVEGKQDRLQAFARLENCSSTDTSVTAELFLDGALIDADVVPLKAGGSGGVVFDLADIHSGTLRLALQQGGALRVDDEAWTVVHPHRHSKVLLVTPGNQALESGLTTASELADVTVVSPDSLKEKASPSKPADAYDLVVYDQCRPTEMPRCNTLFIGTIPVSGWSAGPKHAAPQILDVDSAHPIMQLIDLSNVRFAEGHSVKGPPGTTALVDSDAGVLLAIGPREGFEDAVLGVEIVGIDEQGEQYINTNWQLRLSFPVFLRNTLEYLAANQGPAAAGSVQPGQTVTLKSESPRPSISVRTPAKELLKLERGPQGTFSFGGTQVPGVYDVEEAEKVAQRFAVNLFDALESDIRPRDDNTIKIGYVDVEGQSARQPARREAWKLLLLAALGVLTLEWYIYNRRVYV